MAGKAAGDHGAPDLHRIGTRCDMAHPAREHRISIRFGHQLRVLLVGKPQIGWTRPVGWAPVNSALDRAIVARLAIGRTGPPRLLRMQDACVTPETAGKDGPVLPVVEAILNGCSPRDSYRGSRSAQQYPGKGPRFHRAPAGGIRGKAGGRGTKSARLRNSRVARAVRRV